MAKRKIIKIIEDKCTGCGKCIPDCPEGALQVIDGKARLVSDLFCDGLGACIKACPFDAMIIEEREAEPYNERIVMENIIKAGPNTIKAHLEHLNDHGELDLLAQAKEVLEEKGIEIPKLESHTPCQCPGSMAREMKKEETSADKDTTINSQLGNWPIQLHLLNPNAPYLKNADILIAADCTAFSLGAFHPELLKGKVLAIGCPKLDDADAYIEKLAHIFKHNEIKSITLAIMEVPCCGGMKYILNEALNKANKDIEFKTQVISIKGEVM